MRTVIQRVKYASVTIDGNLKSKIGKGLLILVGIEDRDPERVKQVPRGLERSQLCLRISCLCRRNVTEAVTVKCIN